METVGPAMGPVEEAEAGASIQVLVAPGSGEVPAGGRKALGPSAPGTNVGPYPSPAATDVAIES